MELGELHYMLKSHQKSKGQGVQGLQSDVLQAETGKSGFSSQYAWYQYPRKQAHPKYAGWSNYLDAESFCTGYLIISHAGWLVCLFDYLTKLGRNGLFVHFLFQPANWHEKVSPIAHATPNISLNLFSISTYEVSKEWNRLPLKSCVRNWKVSTLPNKLKNEREIIIPPLQAVLWVRSLP